MNVKENSLTRPFREGFFSLSKLEKSSIAIARVYFFNDIYQKREDLLVSFYGLMGVISIKTRTP